MKVTWGHLSESKCFSFLHHVTHNPGLEGFWQVIQSIQVCLSVGCLGFQQMERVKDYRGQVTTRDFPTRAYNRAKHWTSAHKGRGSLLSTVLTLWTVVGFVCAVGTNGVSVMRVDFMLSVCGTRPAVRVTVKGRRVSAAGLDGRPGWRVERARGQGALTTVHPGLMRQGWTVGRGEGSRGPGTGSPDHCPPWQG